MLWMALSDGDPAHRTYVQDLLFRQTATRSADPCHHPQPAWYFARVVAVSWLPFSLLLPWPFKPSRQPWRARAPRVPWPPATRLPAGLSSPLIAGNPPIALPPSPPTPAPAAATSPTGRNGRLAG